MNWCACVCVYGCMYMYCVYVCRRVSVERLSNLWRRGIMTWYVFVCVCVCMYVCVSLSVWAAYSLERLSKSFQAWDNDLVKCVCIHTGRIRGT